MREREGEGGEKVREMGTTVVEKVGCLAPPKASKGSWKRSVRARFFHVSSPTFAVIVGPINPIHGKQKSGPSESGGRLKVYRVAPKSRRRQREELQPRSQLSFWSSAVVKNIKHIQIIGL